MNFRDIGGNYTVNHINVKKNLIFRSVGLSKMNEEEIQELKDIPIYYILDLRGEWEVKKHPDKEIEGAIFLPYSHISTKEASGIHFGFLNEKYTKELCLQHISKLENYYKQMPYDNEMIKVLFDALLQKKTPLLIHCANGKDRTGVCCMVILKLLGVSNEEIVEDYVKSNEAFQEEILLEVKRKQEDLKEIPELLPIIQMSKGVRKEIIELVIEELERRYPTMEMYLHKEYGYSYEDIQKIKELYIK